MITHESHPNPFRFLDAKVTEFREMRDAAKDSLRALGWVLRPNHPHTGMWRARKWTKKSGTERLFAPTRDELIALAMKDFEARAEGSR